MGEKIKNRPFCGGEVSIAEIGDEAKHWYYITRGIGENRCKCRVFMESEQFYDDAKQMAKDDIKAKLINEWNTRTCICRK